VCVTAPTRLSLAGVSRGVGSHLLVTNPLAHPAAYVAELGRLLPRQGESVLLPVTDASLEAVLEHRSALPRQVGLPFPDLATYRAASDKAHILTLAERCGFAIPDTRVVATRAERAVAVPDAFFPAVVKPHRSVVGESGARCKVPVTPVADALACRRALDLLPPAAFPVLLQRHVSGVGEGFFALRWGGRTIAMFAHRRLREKPPSGGISVYRESIPLDERLAGPGVRLLDALNWQGVAMIECKRDAETGAYVVMEINGRFWGSLQLAIDAGVDFPALLVRCARGESVAATRDYRVGVRSRWFWGDVDQLYRQLGGGGGGRALLEFLRISPGRTRSEVWRWRDPVPFFVETLQWLGLTPHTAGARSRSRAAPIGSAPDSAVP
jgi:predicted ATP-grasp superfamily ATP-dependent carboligase